MSSILLTCTSWLDKKFLCKNLKMLFWLNVLLGLFGTMAAGQTIFDNMSPEEIKQFFGTPDGVVPEYHLIKFDVSSRMKRSPGHDMTLKLNLNGTLFHENLHFVHDNHLIGDKRTGIFLATAEPYASNAVSYEPDPTLMNQIGDLSFYQNIKDGSALTYFHKSKTFSGVLREHWALKPLCKSSLKKTITPIIGHAVQMRSVNSEEDESEDFDESGPLHALFDIRKVSKNHLRHRKNTNMIKPIHNRKKRQSGKSRKSRSPPKFVYPKLLMIVDYDSLTNFNFQHGDFLEYLITFLNVVDMTYRRINEPSIRISIAGIIMSKDSFATPYIAWDTSLVDELNADDVIDNASDIFDLENERFPIDRYEIPIIMTEKWLFCYEDGTRMNLEGRSFSESACDRWSSGQGAGVVIFNFDSIFGGVSTMAHELAHVFSVDHDPECPIGERLIMSADDADSLAWSDCSKQALKKYLNSDNAKCLKSPLKEVASTLKDKKGAWLSPNAMCDNIFENSSESCVLRNFDNICNRLGCMVKGECVDSGQKPWDGADCGNGKACQDSQCV